MNQGDIAKDVLILESNEHQLFQAKDVEIPKGALMYIEGVYATMDKTNANKHRYNQQNYESVLSRLYPKIQAKALLGEVEHVKQRNIDYNRVSHRIESINYDPQSKKYTGGIMILDTDKGRNILYPIAASGSPIFVSSRATGDVNFKTGEVMLNYMVTYDAVGEPGFDEAEFTPGRNRIVTEGFVFESKDGSDLWVPKTYWMGMDNANKRGGVTIDESEDNKDTKESNKNDDTMTPDQIKELIKESVSELELVNATQMSEGLQKFSDDQLKSVVESTCKDIMASYDLTDDQKEEIVAAVSDKTKDTVDESIAKAIDDRKLLTIDSASAYNAEVLVPEMQSFITESINSNIATVYANIDAYNESIVVPEMQSFVTESLNNGELIKIVAKPSYVLESKTGDELEIDDVVILNEDTGEKATVIEKDEDTQKIKLQKIAGESDDEQDESTDMLEMDYADSFVVESHEPGSETVLLQQDQIEETVTKLAEAGLTRSGEEPGDYTIDAGGCVWTESSGTAQTIIDLLSTDDLQIEMQLRSEEDIYDLVPVQPAEQAVDESATLLVQGRTLQSIVDESVRRAIASKRTMVLESSDDIEATIKRIVDESRDILIDILDGYIQNDVLPEVSRMVNEASEPVNLDEIELPAAGDLLVATDDFESINNNPIFADAILKVMSIGDDNNVVVVIDGDDEDDETKHMTITYDLYKSNTAGYVNESIKTANDFAGGVNSIIAKAQQDLTNAKLSAASAEADINYVNEGFVVHMPQRLEATWKALPQASKDLLASQAKLRTIKDKQSAEQFWNSRDMQVIKAAAITTPTELSQLRNSNFATRLKRSIA